MARNYGLFWCKWSKKQVINGCTVYVDTERVTKRNLAKHLLREEFTQTLGLMNDMPTHSDSIFYNSYSETEVLSQLDKRLVCFLYSDKLKPGIGPSEIRKIYRKAKRNLVRQNFDPCI